MFHWLRRRRLHLYAGYVSARRLVGQEPETLIAPFVVVASQKKVAEKQGNAWLRGHCPIEHGWYKQHVELMQVSPVMLRLRTIGVFDGLQSSGRVRVTEDMPKEDV